MTKPQEITFAEVPITDNHLSIIDDAAQLLSHEAYSDHVNPEEVRNSIELGRLVVALSDSQGVIGAGLLRLRDRTASIAGIAVSPGHQGEGMGTKIMAELEKIAVDSQVETIYISPTNNRAAKLYERLGYQEPPIGDALFLQKSIKS